MEQIKVAWFLWGHRIVTLNLSLRSIFELIWISTLFFEIDHPICDSKFEKSKKFYAHWIFFRNFSWTFLKPNGIKVNFAKKSNICIQKLKSSRTINYHFWPTACNFKIPAAIHNQWLFKSVNYSFRPKIVLHYHSWTVRTNT